VNPPNIPLNVVIENLKERFQNAIYLHKAICNLATGPSIQEVVENFLRDLENATQSYAVEMIVELSAQFTGVAENHICKGSKQPVADSTLVLIRVCSVKGVFKYFARESFSDDENDPRFIEALNTFRAAIGHRESSHAFLEGKLKGLRSLGRAFWLTPGEEVRGCTTYADYNRVLGLEDEIRYAFVFEIGAHHVGATPVEKGNDGELMTLHLPTDVDGMYYEKFTPGGTTVGGAREYVSKLNNFQAIDHLRIIE
jgi:hypothetical protein